MCHYQEEMEENYLIDSLQYKVQPVTAIDVAALWKERLLLFILLRLLSRPELILLGLLLLEHPSLLLPVGHYPLLSRLLLVMIE